MARAYYLPSPEQDDAAAQTRAVELGCAGFTRHVPQRAMSDVQSLPAVYVEGAGQHVIVHEPTTRADVDDARAPLQAQDDALAAQTANETAIRGLLRSALTANQAFLALANPSNTQIAAQVRTLTRETSGLIRLALVVLDAVET